MAKVSASALEAREMGYLKSDDVIIANPNELLYVAKQQALSLLESGFKSPLDATFKVVGKAGYANIMAQIAKTSVDCNRKVVAEIVTGANIKRAKGLFKPPVKNNNNIN